MVAASAPRAARKAIANATSIPAATSQTGEIGPRRRLRHTIPENASLSITPIVMMSLLRLGAMATSQKPMPKMQSTDAPKYTYAGWLASGTPRLR